MLFDPTEDEKNELILKGKSLQLSCAGCFSAIAFTNESTSDKKPLFECDYLVTRAEIVDANLEIDQSKVIEQNKAVLESDHHFSMLFFKCLCRHCQEPIGFFDFE